MAKAVIGAAEIGVGALLVIEGWSAPFGWGLIMAGAGEILAYVADILQGNPALTASSKLPSAPREVVYGTVRKGGTFIYQSTTGHQLNQVIVWSAKPCRAIVALYIDQRRHVYTDDSTLSQRSPFGGGEGDGNTYTDDSGNNYNFAGQVAAWHQLGRLWVQGRDLTWSSGMTASRTLTGDAASTYDPTIIGIEVSGTWYVFACVSPGTAGTDITVFNSATAAGSLVTDGGVTWVCCGQAPGGYWFTQLHNQDTSQWANDCLCVQLCATYLKLEYDANLFSGPPQLRATIQGKNDIYDPRTTLRGYSNNWALCIADFLCDPEFGFGVDYATGIDEDQLIAAANICDEQVLLSEPAGRYESRYTVNGWFNSDQEPGQILASMLMAAEGRITRQGGVYKIYPAAWYGSTLTFGENDLCGPVKWEQGKFRDRINEMRATFVCPQYPYQIIGFDNDHKDPDIFAGEWQPTDAPPYAQDYLHGYGLITDPFQGDANLAADGGVRLYQDRRYQFVTSAATCQRLMKIYMLRQRFKDMGSGTLPMKLSALNAQCQDVVSFTFAALELDDAYLDIMKFDWVYQEDDTAGGGEGARPVRLTTSLEVQLTDPSIYDWSPAEQVTLFNQPSPYIENAFQVSPPTGMAAVSDITTAVVDPLGNVTPRIKLTWTEPADPFVTSGGSIQIQISPHSAATWVDVLTLAGVAHLAYLANVVAGSAYDLRIRAVRPSGAYSVWVELDNISVGSTTSATGLNPVAPAGTLAAQAFSDGTAAIAIFPFTATVGLLSVSCTPSPDNIDSLNQSQLYYLYYQDPTFAGGTITPVATQNTADFVGRPGYFLIGSIVTPSYGTRYQPSSFSDSGQTATLNAAAAYDNNVSTDAVVSGVWGTSKVSGVFVTWTADGDCIWDGFPAITSTGALTLHVIAAVDASLIGSGSFTADIVASIAGTPTTLLSVSSSSSQADHTVSVPIGTDLSTISVRATTTTAAGTLHSSGRVSVEGFEIYIQ